MRKSAAALIVAATLMMATAAPAVVINEFMYNTEGNNYFIELYNRSGTDGFDISNWKVARTGKNSATYSDLVTIPDGTTLPLDGHFLIASQDVFVTVPDMEVSFTLIDPAVPAASVQGLRLSEWDGSAYAPHDTVLYGYGDVAVPTGLLDDAGTTKSIDCSALQVGASAATIDLSANVGTSARRSADGGVRGDEGDGMDTNDSSHDFVAAEAGAASPASMSTPVSLSVFEIN